MKKFLLLSALAAGLAAPNTFAGNVLLYEDFELCDPVQYSSNFSQGWTRINGFDGDEARPYFNWVTSYNESGCSMSGNGCAIVDGPTYDDKSAGAKPRTERLLSPELNLNDTYRLSFNWKAAYASAIEKRDYDLHVYVIDLDTNEETRIFTFSNEQELRDSGVPCDIYDSKKLWTNWAIQSSSFDLSQFQGKRVKIAFDYQMYHNFANILYLDDIKVEQAAAETAPVAQISDSQYNFGTLYIGEKMYSTAFTIKNVGKSGLRITGFEAPEGIGCIFDPEMELSKNQEGQFQLWYKAELTTPATADVVLKTNGGDLTINLKASKNVVPDGYQLELFEGTVPPPGWSTEGAFNKNWYGTPYALEGDQSVVTSGYIEASYFYAPRLDLSKADAPTRLSFTYFFNFDSMDGDTYAGNDIQLEGSNDGGETWNLLWQHDSANDNTLVTQNIDLAAYAGSNNVRLRWVNTAVYYDSEYGMDESGTFFMDRVLLPSVYGMSSVPIADLEPVAPAADAQNILPRTVKLRWNEAQFAEGYKLYLGTSSSNWNVLDGQDVGNATSYEVSGLQYDTEYSWKVVPYNQYGEAENCMVWKFTTQADNTVKLLPWSEGFEGDAFPPLGWESIAVDYSRWSANNVSPFDGRVSASASSRKVGDVISLTTPDIVLPNGEDASLSFWWGNDMSVGLIKDVNAVHTNPTNGSNGQDLCTLSVYADGTWTPLVTLSDPNEEDTRYWIHEQIDLSDYAGKTIALRWTYEMFNYNRAQGVSLDNVELKASSDIAVTFSVADWNAYKINYEKTRVSPEMAMTNFGTQPLTIESVSFDKENFSSTLTPGTIVEPNTAVNFTLAFNAMKTCDDPCGMTEVVSDLVVKFVGGAEATLPVKGYALGNGILFYDFEEDATGQAPAGFTVFDDGKPTNPVTFWSFPNRGNALSFFVLNESQCYTQMACPIGVQGLMSLGSLEDSTADDWLVSPALSLGSSPKLKFDARSWESVNSVLPGNCSYVSVYVSEGNPADKSSFVQLGTDHQLSLYDNNDWEHLEYDLTPYAGKKVHVAIRNVINNGLGSFFDNVEYVDANADASAVSAIALGQFADMRVYTIDGQLVATTADAFNRLPAGIYILKTGANNARKVLKR